MNATLLRRLPMWILGATVVVCLLVVVMYAIADWRLTPLCLPMVLMNVPAASYFRSRSKGEEAWYFSLVSAQGDPSDDVVFTDTMIVVVVTILVVATAVHSAQLF